MGLFWPVQGHLDILSSGNDVNIFCATLLLFGTLLVAMQRGKHATLIYLHIVITVFFLSLSLSPLLSWHRSRRRLRLPLRPVPVDGQRYIMLAVSRHNRGWYQSRNPGALMSRTRLDSTRFDRTSRMYCMNRCVFICRLYDVDTHGPV